ncbi:hypothetical protein [Geomicrobium sediminis]|uniref:Membrane protein n=1 Tax=Geomicrobium sediminis TaxID=1347788 RepID=A0ABS2PG92_9BACL|nr:hypothetical protein [Geomicrobium sediminis]MBM7634096.1 putative membrane protein [Geomicrobium sediminis]
MKKLDIAFMVLVAVFLIFTNWYESKTGIIAASVCGIALIAMIVNNAMRSKST